MRVPPPPTSSLENGGGASLPSAAAIGAGQVIGWHARQSLELEPQALAAWEEFRAAEPFWDEAAWRKTHQVGQQSRG